MEGAVILLPLYKTSKEFSYIYTFNKTSSAAWDLIDGKRTLGDVKEELLDKFEVSEEKLEKELDEFIKDLLSIKAVA
ncbi:MAG: PqqD family protein [Candidatus Omnitrophota bacterium]